MSDKGSEEKAVRKIYRSELFEEFYSEIRKNRTVKTKADRLLKLLRDEKQIKTNFVKKIQSAEFYEMRIQTGNAYRIILFSIDCDNIINAGEVLLLNGFMKKDKSDYKRQIIIARHARDKFMKDEYDSYKEKENEEDPGS